MKTTSIENFRDQLIKKHSVKSELVYNEDSKGDDEAEGTNHNEYEEHKGPSTPQPSNAMNIIEKTILE